MTSSNQTPTAAQGLTDERIDAIWNKLLNEDFQRRNRPAFHQLFARAIESELRGSDADAKDAARLSFVLRSGVPMHVSGKWRCRDFVEQGWHDSAIAAIDAALSQEDSHA